MISMSLGSQHGIEGDDDRGADLQNGDSPYDDDDLLDGCAKDREIIGRIKKVMRFNEYMEIGCLA